MLEVGLDQKRRFTISEEEKNDEAFDSFLEVITKWREKWLLNFL